MKQAQNYKDNATSFIRFEQKNCFMNSRGNYCRSSSLVTSQVAICCVCMLQTRLDDTVLDRIKKVCKAYKKLGLSRSLSFRSFLTPVPCIINLSNMMRRAVTRPLVGRIISSSIVPPLAHVHKRPGKIIVPIKHNQSIIRRVRSSCRA